MRRIELKILGDEGHKTIEPTSHIPESWEAQTGGEKSFPDHHLHRNSYPVLLPGLALTGPGLYYCKTCGSPFCALDPLEKNRMLVDFGLSPGYLAVFRSLGISSPVR